MPMILTSRAMAESARAGKRSRLMAGAGLLSVGTHRTTMAPLPAWVWRPEFEMRPRRPANSLQQLGGLIAAYALRRVDTAARQVGLRRALLGMAFRRYRFAAGRVRRRWPESAGRGASLSIGCPAQYKSILKCLIFGRGCTAGVRLNTSPLPVTAACEGLGLVDAAIAALATEHEVPCQPAASICTWRRAGKASRFSTSRICGNVPGERGTLRFKAGVCLAGVANVNRERPDGMTPFPGNRQLAP